MSSDPISGSAAPSDNDKPRSIGITSETAQTAETPPATAIAAGPAPQVVFTAETPAATPATPPASPGDELIGSWLGAHLYKVDRPFVVLVLILSFLLGSFAAANADLWMNLATGRLLSQGKYQFGVDPFSYTTEEVKGTAEEPGSAAVPWINHSWLYSWIMYGLYSLHPVPTSPDEHPGMLSGAGPVLFKALCITALAGVLLLIRPRNRFAWVGTAGVMFIMVVASSGFTLQPMVISYLFLAITLLVLVRAGVLTEEKDEGGRMKDEKEKTPNSSFLLPPSSFSPRLLWILPPLFALWVNFDVWFILGPLVLAACAVVLGVANIMGYKTRVCPRMLGIVLAVGLVACLVNPHHYHALFTLPAELGYLLAHAGDFWPDGLLGGGKALLDMETRSGPSAQTLSVFSSQYLTRSDIGMNVAGYGFFVLMALVLASFYFCKPSSVWLLALRLLLTVVFGTLALFLAVLVPFFAIVGGAMAILNAQEFLAQREVAEPNRIPEHDLWANACRLSMGFLLFGLFFLAWPGWVNQGLFDFNFASPRRVAWCIDVDPSLLKASQFLDKMHKTNQLKRCFNLTTDIAAFCAWHAPGMQFFIDRRFQLFDRHMNRYLNLVIGLREQSDPNASKVKTSPWEKEFAARGIDYIAGSQIPDVPGFERATIVRLLFWIWQGSGHKKLDAVYLDGKTIVLAYKRPGDRQQALPSVEQEWRRLAFGKNDAAWPEGLPALEEDPGFWQLYLAGQRPHSLALQDAKWLYRYYSSVVKEEERNWRIAYLVASRVMLQLRASPFEADLGPLMILAFYPHPRFIPGRDAPHAEAALLGLKASRQAVLDDPQAAEGYLALAGGCKVLETEQENFWVGQSLATQSVRNNMRTTVRNFQFVYALTSYLKLNPNNAELHWELANYLWQQECFDLSVEHKRIAVGLMDRDKNTNPDALARKRDREGDLQVHAQLVERLSSELDLRQVQSEMDRVEIMVRVPYILEHDGQKHRIGGMGLVKRARELLDEEMPKLTNEVDKVRADHLRVLLALKTGNLWELENKEKRYDFLEMNMDALGPVEFHRLRFYVKAALGDYREADKDLEALEKVNGSLSFGALGASIHCLSCTEPSLTNACAFMLPRQVLNDEVANAYYLPRAERELMRGLMALEVGNTISARSHFDAALEAGRTEEALRVPRAGSRFPDRKIAENYLELMNDQDARDKQP